VKSISILAAILATGALSAQGQATDLNARVILFGEAIQTSGILLGPGAEDKANYQTAPGIRLMGRLDDDSRWNWELGGRFPSTAKMVTNRDIAIPPATPNVLNVSQVKVYYSYWTVGAAYLLPLGTAADLGFHLEGRAETINPKGNYSTTSGGTGAMDAHTVYFRPWLRVSLDLKVKVGSYYTLIGADAGVATIKAKQNAIVPMSQLDSQTLKAMAPKTSFSVYAGMQF
jgi:hypothetical protein